MFGALFVCYNRSLVIVQNRALGHLILKGDLPEMFDSVLTVSFSKLTLKFEEKLSFVKVNDYGQEIFVQTGEKLMCFDLQLLLNVKKEQPSSHVQ
jgi:hypothetical protein